MKILAIDTATEACSAALLWNDEILVQEQIAPQAHTRLILPMVQAVLSDAQASLNQLDAIAFGRGPGSFTGVRIGIGAAQGLAYGAGVPLIAVSTLQMLAQGLYRRQQIETVVSAIDARMNEIYLGAYALKNSTMCPMIEEAVIHPQDAVTYLSSVQAQCVAAGASGTGFTAYTDLAAQLQLQPQSDSEADNLPWAQDMLPAAQLAFANKEYCDPAEATPVYLRDKVTWKKLPGRE